MYLHLLRSAGLACLIASFPKLPGGNEYFVFLHYIIARSSLPRSHNRPQNRRGIIPLTRYLAPRM